MPAPYPNDQGNPTGAIPVWGAAPQFFNFSSANAVKGASAAFAIGYSANIGTGNVNTDVWPPGTAYTFLAAQATLSCVSDNAADSAAGTGARRILIQGLNDLFLPVQEFVNLNGTTPVNTVNQYRRVNRAIVVIAGTSQANVGTVTIAAGANAQAVMPPLIGGARQAVYTVPANRIAILQAADFSIGGTTGSFSAQATLRANVAGDTAFVCGTVWNLSSNSRSTEGVLIGYANPPKTDITVRILSVAQTGTNVSASFALLLLDPTVFPVNVAKAV